MDVMSLRRGLMMGMGGSNVIKGSFRADEIGQQRIYFGRTIQKYIVYFEMTEESKNQFAVAVQSINLNRTYGALAIKWGGCDEFDEHASNYQIRYNGTQVGSYAQVGVPIRALDNDSIEVNIQSLSGNANTLYPGYTYNYMIIPIE